MYVLQNSQEDNKTKQTHRSFPYRVLHVPWRRGGEWERLTEGICFFWSDSVVHVCSADRNFYPDSHLKQQLYWGTEEL